MTLSSELAQGTTVRAILFDPCLDGHHAEYASYLINHLAEMGDDVSFATTAGPAAIDRFRELAPGVRVHSLAEKRSRFAETRGGRVAATYADLRQCVRLVESQQADVLHHLYLDGAELSWLAVPTSATRTWKAFTTLFWLHYNSSARGPMDVPGRAASVAKRVALRSVIRRRRLDHVFVHSERLKGNLLDVLDRQRTLEGLVSVVPDPAPSVNVISRDEARDRLKLPRNRPVLLFFGGLRKHKGPHIFLGALASVPGEWTAVVAGEPQSVSTEKVRRLVAALPDPSRVILRLGFIPDAEVEDYFAAADAVVLPYTGSFGGTSGVLMRAAAAGRPVVATDVGEVGPLVRTHHLGIVAEADSIVAFASALSSFLTNREELTAEMAPQAVEYAHRNSWRAMATAVRAAYLRRLSDRLTSGDRGTPGHRADVP